jgi:hypothetical protein
MDKLIEETTRGGEVVAKQVNPFIISSLFDMPKVGDTTAKVSVKTYESQVSIPFKYTIEEELEPRISSGQACPSKGRDVSVDIRFPCKSGSIEGSIALSVYIRDEDDIHQKILETIGAKLLQLEINNRPE